MPEAHDGQRRPLSIAYLVEDTPIFGGVKVVLQQANLMADRGHRVFLVSPQPAPDWFTLRAEHHRVPALLPSELPETDVTVATFWTTISVAMEGALGEVVHYCQGLEATYTHNQDDHAAIHEAYRRPIPAMAVSPHLVRHLAREYGRPARVVPQPLEPFWRPHWRYGPRRQPRILVTAPFEIDWKGVATSLRAIMELRRRGFDCQLVRLSQWPLSEAERRLLVPQEFHERLQPAEIPALMRSCDLMLSASWEQEGFGLPVLEAMACGLPVVASNISSFREFAAPAARLVPWDQPRAFADAAEEILATPSLWRKLRRSGFQVARRFGERASATAAESALYWVLSGAWRREV